jgi:putative addiction module CopG family antidote
MKISLSPEVERLITETVNSGRYGSADEVVREGLELLREREKQTHRLPSKDTTDFTAAFASIAADVPENEWQNLPADLSKNLDHYLYGAQKTS